MLRELKPGDVVRLKKPHPCGSYDWEIVRLGADVRIKCLKCGHAVLIDRGILERKIKAVTPKTT